MGPTATNLTICLCVPKLPLLSFIPCSKTYCVTSLQTYRSHPVSLPSGHILFTFTFKTNSGIQDLLTITMCAYNLILFFTLQTRLPSDLSSNALSLNKRNEHIHWIQPLIYPWRFNHHWLSSWTTMLINICCVLTHLKFLTYNTGKNNKSNCTSDL